MEIGIQHPIRFDSPISQHFRGNNVARVDSRSKRLPFFFITIISFYYLLCCGYRELLFGRHGCFGYNTMLGNSKSHRSCYYFRVCIVIQIHIFFLSNTVELVNH
ncbi:hypothetical protein CLU79DRAFT_748110 [Phycomyces nitens]|nr:hypothetical protein CLU79DRAFT_748110 [Phycomyces nitens]